ncbi:proteoglycan 4-like [Clytia hemisphaerica]
MMGIMQKCPQAKFYNYVKASNRRDRAGKPMVFPYALHYNQNSAKPTIAFFEISDGKNTFMCGTKPSCPSTPAPTTTGAPTPTNYTGPTTNATAAPTTTMAPTLPPPMPLSGADCSVFLKGVEQGFSDQRGVMEFLVPQKSNEWQLQVGFKPDKLPRKLMVFNRVIRVQSQDKCLYKYRNEPENTYDANTTFRKQYRFVFNRRIGRPQIQYISFKSGNFEMSCGANDCPAINITTARPPTTGPPRNTTTTPLVTSPPLAGDSCAPYIEITKQSAGQKFGIIRITTSSSSASFKIIVGFNASTTGFNIEKGVNRIDNQDTCAGFSYVFQSIPGGNKAQGSTFVYPFSLNFDQTTGVSPMITYIKFVYSANNTESCGKEPVCPATTQAPVTTTTPQPAVTTQQPEATTQKPEETTQQPEATTQQPEATTQQPEATTQQPEATTQEPEATTQEPEATTQEPEATHSINKRSTQTERTTATTQEPEATTQEPEATTQEPEATTQEPDATTQQPEATTQEPEATTQQPEVTTQQPEVTTQQPEATTQQPKEPPKSPKQPKAQAPPRA